MARKKQYNADEKGAELTEMLDSLDKLLDRTKVLYEQYFMGIQKIAPMQLHRDIERKIREITQQQIRNTGLRYRLTTLTQKFGSYNTYWRRTMREIEQGRYVRDVARVQRQARRRGQDVPDEILAAMPKRMRDRVRRDRDKLRDRYARPDSEEEAIIRSTRPDDLDDEASLLPSAPERKRVHQIDDEQIALDDQLDELFRDLTTSAEQAVTQQHAATAATARGAATPAQPASAATGSGRPQPTGPGRPQPTREAAAGKPRRAPFIANRDRGPAPASAVASAGPGANAQRLQGQAPARQAPPSQRRTAQAAPPSRAMPPPGMTASETRNLYNQYVKAQQRVGVAQNLSYDRFTRSLHGQTSKIMKEHNAPEVRFNVVVKDDKVVLQAKPKRT